MNKINNRRKLLEHHILPAEMKDRNAVTVPTADITMTDRAALTVMADTAMTEAVTIITDKAADTVTIGAVTIITDKAVTTVMADTAMTDRAVLTDKAAALTVTGKAASTEIIRAEDSADPAAEEETLTNVLQRKRYLFQENR